MKKRSIKRLIRGGIKVIRHQWNKFRLYIKPLRGNGVSGKQEWDVIVSLTSFPKRIKSVPNCIKTLLNQSYKPDAVILWLAEEQFPRKEADLPKKLTRLQKYGLTIKWCNDIRSYKKLIPCLKEYPMATIITTDDDVYYKSNWLEGLMKAHQQYPNEVCCYRAAKIFFESDTFKREEVGVGSQYAQATYLHQQTGVGGVLYPSGSLFEDVLKENIFMKIADTNDDLWFWLMGVKKGTKVRILENNSFKLYYIGDTQLYSLTSINEHGEERYFKQLEAIFQQYPEIFDVLKQEYEYLKQQESLREE